MTIKIFNAKPQHALKKHLVLSALDSGCALTFSDLWFSFPVVDWSSFLHMIWRAYSALSMSSEVKTLEYRLDVRVVVDSGVEYKTSVWYDQTCGGLRYVSLYR